MQVKALKIGLLSPSLKPRVVLVSFGVQLKDATQVSHAIPP